MRFMRPLLLLVLAAAIAAVVVPSAGALTFPDDICPVMSGGTIRVCPPGTVGKPYTYQLKGRDGTGCVPYVKFTSTGTLPFNGKNEQDRTDRHLDVCRHYGSGLVSAQMSRKG